MKNKTTEEKPNNIWKEIAERALSIVANIPVIEVEFTAEKAISGLAWNFEFQRQKKTSIVKSFQRIIEDFNFSAGSMLRIAQNDEGEWVLIDGQHRLAAIVESGAKLWLLVAVDSRPASVAYANIDNVGSLRSSGDAVHSALGWKTKYWTSMVPTAYIISKLFSMDVVKTSMLRNTNGVTESACVALRKYRNTFEKFTEKNRKEATRAPSAAALIVAAHYQPDKFWPFFERALADDRLPKNSPEKKLLAVLASQCKDSTDRLRVCIHTILCWNAVYKNQELFSLPRIDHKTLEDVSIPAILGTPYTGTTKQ